MPFSIMEIARVDSACLRRNLFEVEHAFNRIPQVLRRASLLRRRTWGFAAESLQDLEQRRHR
jgi:hypothetical protein